MFFLLAIWFKFIVGLVCMYYDSSILVVAVYTPG